LTAFALGLVLTAAFIHASWNYLAKRAGQGGAAFVWLFAAISSAFYAPVAIFVFFWQKPDIGPLQLVFMVGSLRRISFSARSLDPITAAIRMLTSRAGAM
jgi:hypothetical protein